MNWAIKTICESIGLSQNEINILSGEAKVEWVYDCLAIIKTDENNIKKIAERSAIIKYILKDPMLLSQGEIINLIEEKTFPKSHLEYPKLVNDQKFAARHHHVGTITEKLPTEWIERKLGSLILSKNTNLIVDLRNPSNLYLAVTWENGTCLGWMFDKIDYNKIAARAPKHGPYFRGGGMKPRLCRLLTNLLYPLDAVVLDPFCGHGGILREIADHGAFAVGIEINKKLCRELLANNRHFGFDDGIAIIMGDAIKTPLRSQAYMQAVTDPPYAIQTTTKGLDREILILNWLKLQKKDLALVFTTPNNMLSRLPDEWVVDLDEDDFVHKSLTRRIRRACKVE